MSYPTDISIHVHSDEIMTLHSHICIDGDRVFDLKSNVCLYIGEEQARALAALFMKAWPAEITETHTLAVAA